ncbi:hypothetical protein F5Y19DRAFT_408078 [Xylariaceae sp. FL1651]|nr:hypothetical protein F5Y19DRAFT_408078 [Xylariaceae sp. FL1651]
MTYLIFTLLILFHLAASELASITQSPVYASQRPCAQYCFAGFGNGPDILAEGLGCDTKNPQNECICRPDRQSAGDAYLSDCVGNNCSENTIDINSAVSIYDAYCTGAGFLRSTPTTPTSDSSTSLASSTTQSQQTSPTIPASPISPTSHTSSLVSSSSVEDSSSQPGSSGTQAPAPTSSPSGDSSSGGGGNGLGTADIIGIVIGVTSVVIAAIAAWIGWITYKRRR